MSKLYSTFIKIYSPTFLILFLQICLLISPDAAVAAISPAGYAVTPLNLSKPPTVPELMAAGQLGGTLYPTRAMINTVRDAQINASFGEAIQAWNKHDYKHAVKMFKAHVAQYPDSPWASEAVLHEGCDALYHGRYSEADRNFQAIINTNQANPYAGAQMMVHKTRLRLANLRTAQGNFQEAIEQYRLLKQNSPNWRDRTYAAHWIQRLSRLKHNRAAVLNCGFRALACLLEKNGKRADAHRIRGLQSNSDRGRSMQELKSLAAGYGYRLTGLKLSIAQLKNVPLPAIVQLSAVHQGDLGHFWVLEKLAKATLTFYDPQSRRRFNQTTAEFSREWRGNALVFARQKKLPGLELAAREMAALYGGCCGYPLTEDDLGDPDCIPGDTDCPDRGDPCQSESGCGSPAWSVNKISMNFYVKDIPLWYRSPIGPPVKIALSYNSQSANNSYEPFGNKWQFNYATYPIEDTGGQVTVFMPNGRRDVYEPDSSGGYTSPLGIYNTLIKTSPTHYEVWFPDDSVFIYDIPAGTNSLQPFLVEMRDRHGLKLNFSYNSQVQLTSITDAVGRVTTLTYNAAGLVTAVTDPFGRQATFSYDANRNLTKITDMGGYWSTLTYDSNIMISGIANARGAWKFATELPDGIPNGPPDNPWLGNPYPAPGGVMWEDYRLTVTNPLGFKEEYYYYAFTGVWSWHVKPMNYVNYVDETHNNSFAAKTKYEFNMGEVKPNIHFLWSPYQTEDDWINLIYFLSYDHARNLTSIYYQYNADLYMAGWSFAYNDKGRVTSITNPAYKVTTVTYAANNVDPISITNDLGTVTLTYNNTHDVTSITDRLGNTTTYTYNNYGQLTSVQDALGIVNNYIYNDAHDLVAITRDGQTLHQYTYDALDRVRTHTDATGLTLTYDYNNLDQVTRITYPDGKLKSYQYSTCCPFVVDSITDRSGLTTFYSYDKMNHLLSVIDPAGGVTGYGYDVNGNLGRIIDPKRNVTRLYYDCNNRLLKKQYADGSYESYGYITGIPVNRVGHRINARGVTTNYTYSPFLNLASSSDSNGLQISYGYDDYNRMTSVSSPAGTLNYTYDANSRIVGVAGPWANVAYQYDALGRKIGLTRDNGQPVSYSYDNLNRLTSVNVDGTVYTYGYDGASPLVRSLTRPDGAVTTYDYDVLNRLTKMTTMIGEVVINCYAYTYNNQDQRSTEDFTTPDPIAPYNNYLANYTYNRVNELTQVADPASRTLTYDWSGNLTGGFTPQGYPFTATYDSDNHLTGLSYTDGNGLANEIDFFYIGSVLVKKQNYHNGSLIGETRYVYDEGGRLLQERDANNNVVNEYTYGQGLPGGIGGLLNLNQGGAQYSYLYDGKGNVTAILDGLGVTQTYQYDPFGLPMGGTGFINQPIRFSTKLYDDQTGLSYYGYRFYAASLGRWMTRDPLGERAGINLYEFVSNNPINLVDYFGLCDGFPGSTYPGADERLGDEWTAFTNEVQGIITQVLWFDCMVICEKGAGFLVERICDYANKIYRPHIPTSCDLLCNKVYDYLNQKNFDDRNRRAHEQYLRDHGILY